MDQQEIQTLITGISQQGAQKLYDLIKTNGMAMMATQYNLDETIMDRYENFLELARTNEDETTRNIYYSLASLMRKLAEEIHRMYIKQGHKKEGSRFLRLIKNDQAPKLLK